jgi:hypothetical protein
MNPPDDIRNVTPVSSEDQGPSQRRPAVFTTLGPVLDHFKVNPKDLDYIDDPPGKLQAVEFKIKRDSKIVRVEVKLKYTIQLFSATRKWDLEHVRNATVLEVNPPNVW